MRMLYAVAYSKFNPRTKTWTPRMETLHADSQADARIRFCTGNRRMMVRRWIQLVAIAPAISSEGKRIGITLTGKDT